MASSEFIPLSREGIIRFQVVPETRLAAQISRATLDLPALHLQFSGTSVALPHHTPVQVLASVGGPDAPSSAVSEPLSVPGHKPGSSTPTPCTLAATIDLVACEALGKRCTLDLALTPNFPRTAKVPHLQHELDLECRVTLDAPDGACIGTPVTLTPFVGAALSAAHLRLTIKEVDKDETGKPRDGVPTTQFRWQGGLTGPVDQRQRTWHIGCASDSHELEYPHADQDPAYEFTLELELSFDGETFYPIAPTGQRLTVRRPRLAAFDVVQPSPAELAVRVQVDDLDPAFALPVDLELWKLGAKKAAASRRCTFASGLLDEAFDPSQLGLKPGDQVFATLSLAPEAAAHPVANASHWLSFDEERALPGRLAAWVRSARLKLAGPAKPPTTTTKPKPKKK